MNDERDTDLFIFTSTRGMTHILVISLENLKKAAWVTTLCNRTIFPKKNEEILEDVEDVSCLRCRSRLEKLRAL